MGWWGEANTDIKSGFKLTLPRHLYFQLVVPHRENNQNRKTVPNDPIESNYSYYYSYYYILLNLITKVIAQAILINYSNSCIWWVWWIARHHIEWITASILPFSRKLTQWTSLGSDRFLSKLTVYTQLTKVGTVLPHFHSYNCHSTSSFPCTWFEIKVLELVLLIFTFLARDNPKCQR